MTSTKKERSVVVIELQGGNDALNTVIPYNNPLYYDYRNNVGIPEGDVLHLDGEVGFNPNLAPAKHLWDQGNFAIINGIGYPNPNRSHFRSRDVWYTAESEKIGAEGWLGAAIRDLDARGENVLTGVNFGRGLPRAMVCKGVPVASVANLETYGLMPDIQDEKSRQYALEAFSRIYGPTESKDIVAQVLSETGSNALKGADRLRTAPDLYSSSVEYADTPISQSLKNMAQVMSADLGTPHLLHPARQLRHPQQRATGSRQAVDRRVHRHRRLHQRPGGARAGRRHVDPRLLRVRPAHQGQRRRH